MLEWIQLQHLTPDKPEIRVIASMLKMDDKDLAFAKVCRVWIWADKYTNDGTYQFPCQQAAAEQIDEVARCQGFASAMQHAGWLVIDDSGRLILPNYGRNNGQTAKKRIQKSRRQATWRARKK